MEKALVISADRYEFTDEKTGEIRKGVTVNYINDYREDTEMSVGLKPTKISANAEVFDAIRAGTAPALYELDFRTRPGKEGKPTLQLVKATLVKTIDVFEGQ